MIFAYMDESGNSGEKSDPNQPIHLLGCLLVHESSLTDFEQDLDDIAEDCFGDSLSPAEFRASDIYSGKKSFKGRSVQERIAIATSVLESCAKHASAFGYTGVNKIKSYASDHPHRIAFGLMIENLQIYLKVREEKGLIVADEYNEIGKTLINDFKRIKRDGTFWGYKNIKAKNVVDTIHFVRSQDSRIIQACDLMTYFTLAEMKLSDRKQKEFRALEKPWSEYRAWLAENCSAADQATFALGRIANSVTRFRAKIFPEF